MTWKLSKQAKKQRLNGSVNGTRRLRSEYDESNKRLDSLQQKLTTISQSVFPNSMAPNKKLVSVVAAIVIGIGLGVRVLMEFWN